MTEYEYPSDEVLDKIRNWSIHDPEGLLKYLQGKWYYPHFVTVSKDGNEWKFITGGWSGNEALLKAFRDNTFIWMRFWYSSTASGVHKFVLKTRIKEDTCKWTEVSHNDYYFWETECGDTFQFIDGNPSNNHMVYCPYCGRKIITGRLEKK